MTAPMLQGSTAMSAAASPAPLILHSNLDCVWSDSWAASNVTRAVKAKGLNFEFFFLLAQYWVPICSGWRRGLEEDGLLCTSLARSQALQTLEVAQ